MARRRQRGREWSDEERRRRKVRAWRHQLIELIQLASGFFAFVELVSGVSLAGSLLAAIFLFATWLRLRPWVHTARELLPGRPVAAADPRRPLPYSHEPIPAGLRFAVLRRDGFRCAYCGRGESDGVKLHLDHVVPVARGGKTELDNLVTACATCNIGKSASDLVGAP